MRLADLLEPLSDRSHSDSVQLLKVGHRELWPVIDEVIQAYG